MGVTEEVVAMLLKEFLEKRNVPVRFCTAKLINSWSQSEFQIGARIYEISPIGTVIYGPDWYEYHSYKDISGYRVSVSYHFYGLSNSIRKLSIGCEEVYRWKKRVPEYRKMTEKQLDHVVKTYIDAYVKDGCPGNANLDVLERTIKHELSKLYLKLWFEK